MSMVDLAMKSPQQLCQPRLLFYVDPLRLVYLQRGDPVPIYFEKASAMTALLQVADRAGLLKPDERERVLDPHAFLGVSYATIYRRLRVAMNEALDSRYIVPRPALVDEWPNVEPPLRLLLDAVAESHDPLTLNQGFLLLGLLQDGHWQHVYRYMVDGLVQIILTEEADGSV